MAITSDMLSQYNGWNGSPVGTDNTLSVYGRVIPRSNGRRTIEGAPIWASALRFVTVTIPYGHNGTGLTQGTLSWEKPSRDFAVAFGYKVAPEGETDAPAILRMWVDGRLVYDQTDPLVTAPELHWTFYEGTEEQEPDASIVADRGDLAPAYRGMMYIVFKDYELPQVATGTAPKVGWVYQYKIPEVRIEVVDGLQIDNSATAFDMLQGNTLPSNGLMVDWDEGLLYQISGANTSAAKLHTFDIASHQELAVVDITGSYTNLNGNDWVVLLDSRNGKIIITANGISNTSPVAIIDIKTGVIQSTLGVEGSGTTVTSTSVPFSLSGDIAYLSSGGKEKAVAALGSFFADVSFIPYDTDTGAWSSVAYHRRFSDDVTFVKHYPLLEMGGGAGGDQDGCVIVGVGSKVYAEYFGFRNGAVVSLGEILIQDFGTGHTAQQAVIDPSDKGVVLFGSTLDGTTWTARKIFVGVGSLAGGFSDFVSSWNGFIAFFNAPHIPSDTALLFDVSIPAMAIESTSIRNAAENSQLSSGTFSYPSGSQLVNLNLANGKTASVDFPVAFFDYLWDSRTHAVYYTNGGAMTVSGIATVSGDVHTIGEYLLWLALRAGYDEADITVDAALTDPVTGVLITKQYEQQTLFNDLGQAYDFTYFESDGKVKFVKAPRGESEVVPQYSFTVASLGIEGGLTGDDALLTTINEPSKITGSLSLEYLDVNMGDLPSTATYSLDTTTSDSTGTSVQKVSIPIIMTASEANTRATNMTIRASIDLSVLQELHLPQRYMKLEPSDIIQVTVDPFVYIIQLDEVTFNGDWSISLNGYNHSTQVNVVVPDVPTGGDPGGDEDFGLGDSQPLAFDIPLLDPMQDPGTSSIVVETGLKSYGQTNFTNARLEFGPSPDGPFLLLYSSSHPAVHGRVTGVLSDNLHPFCTDDVTTITLALRSGTTDDFASTDYTGLLEGKNQLLVGAAGRWELIFFRDVTIVNDSVVRLSGLLRGRRGTDPSIGLHEAADFAFLIRSNVSGFIPPLTRQTLPAAQVTETGRYFATGTPSSRGPQAEDVTFVGASAKCWRPAQLKAEASGSDINLSWLRRDRLGTEFVTVDQPLSEAEEKYSLEILDGDTIVRTVDNLTSPAYTYLDADQVTDGFTPPQASIKIRVYQISALNGRGYPAEETLDVN